MKEPPSEDRARAVSLLAGTALADQLRFLEQRLVQVGASDATLRELEQVLVNLLVNAFDSVVAGIVQEHGGSVAVESQVGAAG